MRISGDKELYICPIKRLLVELDENLPDRKTIAILLSMEDTVHHNLGLLDSYHKVGVVDTEMEGKPFAFNYDEGLKVKEFLEVEKDFGRLYVCCDSGESRSTAMAAAIMRYYGRSDKEIWENPYYHPNLLVYRQQLGAFGIKISKFRLKYLKYVSDRAFARKVRRSRR